MSTTPKDYFMAGLEMEKAREEKDKAAETLKQACLKVCPTELADYEASKVALEGAEKRMIETMRGLIEEQQTSAHAFMHSRGIDCGDPKCTMKIANVGGSSRDNKAN